MTRARSLSRLGNSQALTVSSDLNVGVNSTSPTEQLHVVGVVSATSFFGSGANLTGVSGFATALSSDQTSPLNVFFKTPKQVNVGAGISVSVESDDTSGNIAFCRENIIYVGVGATFHVGSGTTLLTNVLGIF
jgi:hypothetical protein